ncbi:alpha/beta fold hydrolase [Marinomonas ostreistagni]|uniref:alpha/beta fold hydrolase n=1 Tax=Marinomonas ostreistagni TaxID=359209 RepID=UPI001951C054|nr:alpha/beta hydrolase [Marinomonas ostreistagni]MBM6550192.1 alpha/beta hydrolase [Marinomonas ostreistagni]
MPQETTYCLGHTKLAALQWLSGKDDAQPILLLHGWLDNAASFCHLAPNFKEYDVTALDLAGHGRSQHRPPGSFYHMWDYALDVISLLQQSQQPVWLMGHSMGGGVAMLVAALAPEKVRGLIVLDSLGPATAQPHERVKTMRRAIQKMLKQRAARSAQYTTQAALIEARMQGFTKLSYAAAKPLVERGADCVGGEWSWRADQKLSYPSPFRMDDAAVTAYIDEIQCPTLLLLAKQGIFQNALQEVQQSVAAFKGLTLEWLPGNHHFHLEPDTSLQVAQEIRQFIDQN